MEELLVNIERRRITSAGVWEDPEMIRVTKNNMIRRSYGGEWRRYVDKMEARQRDAATNAGRRQNTFYREEEKKKHWHTFLKNPGPTLSRRGTRKGYYSTDVRIFYTASRNNYETLQNILADVRIQCTVPTSGTRLGYCSTCRKTSGSSIPWERTTTKPSKSFYQTSGSSILWRGTTKWYCFFL